MKRYNLIANIIDSFGLKNGAEIGVGTGPTTDFVLSRFPDLLWLAVDYWPAGLALHYGGELSAHQQKERRSIYMEKVVKFGPRLTLLEKPSVDAAKEVEDGVLDLVFIDADHSYEACKSDIAAWRPKVRKGGWLMGHDYHKGNFPGVVRAVDEMVPGFKLECDDVWMVQV